ncbi:MAG: hypothetical protein QM579_01730, partial [Desulfovibrio sp.]
VTRALTRIWRRSINIAEHVYFISRGESLKHKGENREEALSSSVRPSDFGAPADNAAATLGETSEEMPASENEKGSQRRRRTEKDTENA